jgi:hypothetical protein
LLSSSEDAGRERVDVRAIAVPLPARSSVLTAAR